MIEAFPWTWKHEDEGPQCSRCGSFDVDETCARCGAEWSEDDEPYQPEND